jgi:hypothetical protein
VRGNDGGEGSGFASLAACLLVAARTPRHETQLAARGRLGQNLIAADAPLPAGTRDGRCLASEHDPRRAMTDDLSTLLAGLSRDYLLSQAFALLSLLLIMIGFLQRADTRLKWLMLVSCLTMAPHFYFLGAWGGFIINFVVTGRYVAALKWPGSRLAFLVFVTAGTALGLWFYKDARDLLVIAANFFGCAAVFLNKGVAMRRWFLPTSVCWLTYNALNLSIFGVAFESFCFATNLLGIWRIRRQAPAAPVPCVGP